MRSQEEAQVLEAVGTTIQVVLVAALVVPLALQIVASGAMSKLWACFNSLQLINSFPLFKIDMPANVMTVVVEFEKITKLELVKPEVVMGWFRSLFPRDEDDEEVVAEHEPRSKVDKTALALGIDKTDVV